MAQIAADIVIEVLLTLVLLLGLSAVHLFLSYSGGSEEFKLYFVRIHEFFLLFAYVMIALKGLIRILTRIRKY
jgi:hypothetical protein